MLAILSYSVFIIAGLLVVYSLATDLHKLVRLLRADKVERRRVAAIGRRLA